MTEKLSGPSIGVLKEAEMEKAIDGRLPWSDGGGGYQVTPHANLAATIIKTAVDDYIGVLCRLKERVGMDYGDAALQAEKRELERFFRSEYYEFYAAFLSTEITPEAILKNCAARAEERYHEKIRKQAKRNTKEGGQLQ